MVATGDSRLGTIIGNCRLLSVLGAGSTSTVYLGQPHDDPRGPVAVKVLHPHLLGDTDDYSTFRKRFEREAQAASKLQNEHIVPVLDYGETDGTPYMVMPLIDGGTLADRLAQAQQTHSPLTLREIEGYLSQLADALDVAHAQGMVHRDVKPSNVLLDRLGRVYLTDFGIARLFNDSKMTKTGQVVGTPYYMAPEQANGDRPVTAAADIYALGVVLYQMVTGQVPFHADTPMIVLVQHIQEPPRPPTELRADLPPAIEATILRALAKDPHDRFATAGELAQAYAAGVPEGQEPESAAPAAQTWRTKSIAVPRSAISASSPASDTNRPAASYAALVGSHIQEFHLERLISFGELGAVFVARPEGFTAPRWLRVQRMPRDLSPTERVELLARFTRGAEELATLQHPNLLQVLAYGSDRDLLYLVMPEVTSKGLRATLEDSGPIDPQRTAAYLDQIADALDRADSEGIHHLGLNTDCVYVDKAGHVLVADCGMRDLLVPATAASDRAPLYITSDVLSPEQLLGHPVGAYTDVYALGALTYELLAGHPVFEGQTTDDVAQQHLHSSVPSLLTQRAALPAALDGVLAKALAKEPAQRYQHAGELARAYRSALAPTSQTLKSADASAMRDATGAASARPPTTSRARDNTLGTAAGSSVASTRARMTSGQTDPARSRGTDSSSAESSVRVRRAAVRTRSGEPIDGGASVPAAAMGSATGKATGAATAAFKARSAPARPLAPSLDLPPRSSTPIHSKRRLGMWIGTAAALVAVVVGTVALLQTFGRGHGTAPRASIYAHASGTVSFFDVGGSPGDLQTDALLVNVNGLPVPASGSSYQVWFVDRPDEAATNEGVLSQANNAWILQNPAPGGPTQPGPNLLAFSQKALAAEYIEVSLETSAVHVPTGPVVLSAKIPSVAFTHMQHLLVAFSTNPGGTGYLVGMMQQMQELDRQVNSLQDKVTRNLPGAAQCATQNIINLIEGAGGPHFKDLSAYGNECPTFGIAQSDARLGLDVVSAKQPGWVQGIEDHVTYAIESSDATKNMKSHAPHVLTACEDLITWLGQMDSDAVGLLNSGFHKNQVGAQVQALVTLEHKALYGTTLFGEEQPQPGIKGEFGANQAYIHGQYLATLQLTPAS